MEISGIPENSIWKSLEFLVLSRFCFFLIPTDEIYRSRRVNSKQQRQTAAANSNKHRALELFFLFFLARTAALSCDDWVPYKVAVSPSHNVLRSHWLSTFALAVYDRIACLRSFSPRSPSHHPHNFNCYQSKDCGS